jgi:hypothetical protein
LKNENDVLIILADSFAWILRYIIFSWWICWNEISDFCFNVQNNGLFWEVIRYWLLLHCFRGCCRIYTLSVDSRNFELNYHGQDNADLKHRLIYSKISMFVATCHLRMREPVDLFATTLNLYCTHMVMNTFAVSLWPVVIAEFANFFLKQTIFCSFWLLQLIFNLKFIFKLTFIRIYIFK